MTIEQAAVLGCIQGLTEFLPISSSAHLIIVPWLLRWPEPGLAFNVALHLGTLSAVVVYFARDIWAIVVGWLRAMRSRQFLSTPEARLGWAVLVGSIPAGIVGFLANDVIDAFFHSGGGGNRAIGASALLLIGLGLLLWAAERTAGHSRALTDLRVRDGLWIGLAQTFALLPGVSRSGSTITAALFLGFERATAARFSFLLGIPAMVGAGALEALHLVQTGLGPNERAVFVTGVVAAGITGFLAIAFLLRFLQRFSTRVFVLYRIGFGLLVLLTILVWR